MRVWIMAAEHPTVPGQRFKVHATREGAVESAIKSIAMMPGKPKATPETWEKIVERLEDEYGARYCYVDITEHEVLP